MDRYVVGFAFTPDQSRVCLIQKNRPVWQKGLLNGVGGHIEDGETPATAMRREFREEAGVSVYDWRQFCRVWGEGYELFCFTATPDNVPPIHSMTDESVDWYPADELPPKALATMSWMLPMARYEFPLTGEIHNPYC